MVQRNIVVLGASFSGIQLSHYILKHVIPKLPASDDSFHLYLLNSSSDFYHRISAPRAILNDKDMAGDKSFIDIRRPFDQYGDRFTFVEGIVTRLDTDGRRVVYETKGDEKSLVYDALIIATGASTPSPLFSPNPTTAETRNALRAFRSALPAARTIVIGGGGPVGVESAGEIGDFLNGSPGYFCTPERKARVVLVTAGSKLLPVLREDVAKQAESFLKTLGVEVMYDTKVENVSPPNAGLNPTTVVPEKGQQVEVRLSSGKMLKADIYIPATGVKPNSSFVPSRLLNDTGRIRTTPELRVDGAGSRIYAIGDVSSQSPGGVPPLNPMVPVVATNLKRDLLAFVGGADEPIGGKDRTYEPDKRATQFVPIGRGKGVGQVFGWRAPSLMVWMLKGRDYLTSATDVYLNGNSVKKESVWKFDERAVA